MTLVNIYSMLSIYQSRLPKSSTINVINRNDSILFWINFIYNRGPLKIHSFPEDGLICRFQA